MLVDNWIETLAFLKEQQQMLQFNIEIWPLELGRIVQYRGGMRPCLSMTTDDAAKTAFKECLQKPPITADALTAENIASLTDAAQKAFGDVGIVEKGLADLTANANQHSVKAAKQNMDKAFELFHAEKNEEDEEKSLKDRLLTLADAMDEAAESTYIC